MGFSTSAILYLSLFFMSESPFDTDENRRPELTSHLLRTMHERFKPIETTNDSSDPNSTLRMVAHQDADFEAFQKEFNDAVQSGSKDGVAEFRSTDSLFIGGGQTVHYVYPEWNHGFFLTGHLGWALLIGCLSGSFCQYIYRNHRHSLADVKDGDACFKGLNQCD